MGGNNSIIEKADLETYKALTYLSEPEIIK